VYCNCNPIAILGARLVVYNTHLIHALCVYEVQSTSSSNFSSLSISSYIMHSLDKVTWAVPGLPANTPMVEDDPAALNTPGATCGITMTTGHNYGELLYILCISCVFSRA